jgi:hypothetical protein
VLVEMLHRDKRCSDFVVVFVFCCFLFYFHFGLGQKLVMIYVWKLRDLELSACLV